MLTIIRTALGFVPVVGPILSGALGAVGGAASAVTAMSWKSLAAIGGVLLVAFGGWEGIGYVRHAQADHLAVATLQGQLTSAVATANANAAALEASEAQHAKVLKQSSAATAAASARAASLAATLETIRNAQKSVCTPSAAAVAALGRLRQ
jgi:hypothetical protein